MMHALRFHAMKTARVLPAVSLSPSAASRYPRYLSCLLHHQPRPSLQSSNANLQLRSFSTPTGNKLPGVPPEVKPELVVTAVGAHQAGMIAAVSGIIADSGASIVKTHKATLDDVFCLVMLVWVGDTQKAQLLQRNLRAITQCKVTAEWHPKALVVATTTTLTKRITKRIRWEGPQQAGLIFKVSSLLTDKGVSLPDLHSDVYRATDGTVIFQMDGHMQIPQEVDLEALSLELGELADTLSCKFTMTDPSLVNTSHMAV